MADARLRPAAPRHDGEVKPRRARSLCPPGLLSLRSKPPTLCRPQKENPLANTTGGRGVSRIVSDRTGPSRRETTAAGLTKEWFDH
jgi:hypothetical protein